MKKNLIIVAILSVVLYSCKKDELVTTVKGPGVCVVSGDVQANYNTCNDSTSTGSPMTTLDNVSGVNITFVIDSRNLDRTPSDDFEYEDLSYTTHINNGTYSIELPAISTPYTVQVYFDSYNHNQTSCVTNSEWDGMAWITSTEYTASSVNYSLSQMNISDVVDGSSIVRNFTYED